MFIESLGRGGGGLAAPIYPHLATPLIPINIYEYTPGPRLEEYNQI